MLALSACSESPPPSEATNSATTASADLPESLPVVGEAELKKIIEETAASDQILVIDFWATWCIPCREMFGPLHDQMAALGGDVRLISVTLDTPGDYEQEAISFLDEHHAIEDAYLLTPETEDQIKVVEALGDEWYDLVVPVVLVFGADGKLKGEFLDEVTSVEPIAARVRELVEAKKLRGKL